MMTKACAATFVAALAISAPCAAQQAVTTADYARAERASVAPGAAVGGTVAPNWLPDGRFWYRSVTPAGSSNVLIDPVKKTRSPYTGDTTRAAPEAAGGRGGRGGGRGGTVSADSSSDRKPLTMSPDNKRGVFIRDWNLWVRDIATGQEKQLTRDGTRYNGYATDNAGWSGSDRARVTWSPDSRKVATFQQDERNVGEMYLVGVPTGPPYSDRVAGHPALRTTKFPLPGDSIMPMLSRVIIDADAATITRVQMPPDFHRGTLTDNILETDAKWSPDASHLVIASVSRDHKHAWLSDVTVATGAVRHVYDEVVPTQYEARTGWQVLWKTNEFIWYSDRSGWGQLYLYDLATGKLKNQITTGEGVVMQIPRLNDTTRVLWYMAQGKEAGQQPYYAHFYRVNLDGTKNVSLTPDDGTHTMQLSADGRYVVDTYSKPDVPPVTVLRDGLTGAALMPLETADISALKAAGWNPPRMVRMLAHDGKTDIYGMMYVPSTLDPSKKYPIINHIYPGPQTGSVGGGWGFRAGGGEPQGLAELGFIVVEINGMGTPGRSKAFQDEYYGAMGRDNTLPDQIAGMKQLAQRYPYIDLTRVGIYGHSGGGFATGDAMFRYPEFFKVGIAESGNHDQRENEDDWGERYQGLVVRNADGTDNYTQEANQNFAGNLQGHLLLAHGTWDTNVPPPETFLMVDALIKANKDFDLLLIPNSNHGYGAASQYMQRRRWDYFVKWLLNTEPPKEYQFGGGGGRGGRGGRGVG